jgi:hypothetical protein
MCKLVLDIKYLNMKNKFFIYIILLLFAFALTFCKKQTDSACLFNPGKFISLDYILEDFDTIIIKDVFEINLKCDTINMISINAYENFAKTVDYQIDNKTLTLSNNSKCNWLNPQTNKISINISYKKIDLITVDKSCIIRTINPIKTDKFGMILKDKIQDIDIEVDTDHFYFWNHSPCGGEIKISGRTNIFMFWSTALLRVDALELNSDIVFAETKSRADSYIKANKEIHCNIKHIGNVYYVGNPGLINFELEGEGSLIKID